jgi:hypothetical protein
VLEPQVRDVDSPPARLATLAVGSGSGDLPHRGPKPRLAAFLASIVHEHVCFELFRKYILAAAIKLGVFLALP